MFTHLYKCFVSCVKPCSQTVDSNSPTLLHWRRWLGLVPLQIFTESSKLALRAGFDRGTLVWDPLHGEHQEFYSHNISVQDEKITPKIDAQSSTPVSHPQSYELAICRMKRGGVEVIMVGHIFQASLV